MRTPWTHAGLKPVILLLAVLAPVLILTASCRNATPPMHFYSLTPLDEPLTDPDHRAMGVAVGVGPLDIPLGVDRPNIVTRTGPNSLNLAEYHRWSGTLQGDMLEVLTQNLSLLLESDRVVEFPWSNFMIPEYRVPITVHRLDGALGGEVVLDATWAIARGATRQSLVVHRSVITQTAQGPEYADLVAASSRAVAALSRAIAEEMLRLRGR